LFGKRGRRTGCEINNSVGVENDTRASLSRDGTTMVFGSTYRQQKTRNDDQNPETILIGEKAGKRSNPATSYRCKTLTGHSRRSSLSQAHRSITPN